MEEWWDDIARENLRYSERTCPSDTLSTRNPTCIALSANPGLHDEKPAISRLCYSTACDRNVRISSFYHRIQNGPDIHPCPMLWLSYQNPRFPKATTHFHQFFRQDWVQYYHHSPCSILKDLWLWKLIACSLIIVFTFLWTRTTTWCKSLPVSNIKYPPGVHAAVTKLLQLSLT
jgi:hypothetical protein